jgi:DNA polymerase-4
VASNKFVAKVASDLDKPDGLVVVEPGREGEFLAPLHVERIWGVGPRTAEILHARGDFRIAALQAREESELVAIFGTDFGRHLYHLARGVDARPVLSHQEPKSVSAETTLGTFLAADDHDAIDAILLSLSDEVSSRMRRQNIFGQTLTLKVRNDQFNTRTRSVTLPQTIQSTDAIYREAVRVFRGRVDLEGRRVRLLGVGLSQLRVGAPRQLDLLDGPGDDRTERIEKAVDAIRDRLGDRAITRGRLLDRGRRGAPDSESPS